MREQAFTILIALAAVHLVGSIFIELIGWNKGKRGYTGRERRKTRKVAELEPLGESMLKKTSKMLEQEEIDTRTGLKFIIEMMQELYLSDIRRTLKVNELVEQFDVIQHKTLISWIEARPKLALFLSLVAMAMVIDEIREPIMRYALAQIGVSLP